MALIHDLQTLLKNPKELVIKRIKIADNAFKSTELLLPHKEFVLLEWILNDADTYNSNEKWETFYNWISSDQFKELNRNDIDNKEILRIIELIQEKLTLIETVEYHILKTIINSFFMLIEHVTFQQYFNHNVEIYCQLICRILDKIQSVDYLDEFLKKNLFPKAIMSEEKFHKCFLGVVLPAVATSLLKFDKNTTLFEEISRVVKKCVFYRNRDNFVSFIKQFFEDVKTDKHSVPKILFKHILQFYEENTETSRIKYKLIFCAFCVEFEGDYGLIFNFFILLIHTIGFSFEGKVIFHKAPKLEITESKLSLKKSLELILELFDILSRKHNILSSKINELTFTEFIKNILRQILYFNTPSDTCYNIFMKAIIIDPILIESVIDGVIVYAMMADNRKHKKEYESLITSIFELYSKLHRTENLVAKIVYLLNDSFNNKTITLQEIYKFRGKDDVEKFVMKAKDFEMEDIFTKNILDYLSTCICNLASWQVINVFKTLLYYLNKNLNNIVEVKSDDLMYFTYVEILSGLIGTLLSSIRIAEHTVATNVVGKSLREMEELRNLLQQFGMALLNREHNHRLMQSFLNIAYHWAELYIILAYYSINSEVQLKTALDNNFTSCNITYIHSYLNVTQWCLISERITNFGELPCKQLLKKLYIQKVKAMLLFEETVNDDVDSNVLRSITTDLENNWKDILYNKYIVNNLLVKMNSTTILCIAENLINNVDNLEEDLHKQILDAPLLLTAVIYLTVTKINKAVMKQKRKLNENIFKTTVSSKICSLLTDDILCQEDHRELIEKVKETYYSGDNGQTFEWKINEEKIMNLLEILKKFPVIYSSEVVQKICLVYLCSLHKDLLLEFRNGKYSRLQATCEDIIIGILQHNKFKMLDVLQVDIICDDVINEFKEWEHIFSLITENVFKSEYSIKKYESLVSTLSENVTNPKHMTCCFMIINAANKIKKTKMPKDVKAIAEKYKTMVCDKILETVSENQPDFNLINGYAYALRNLLSQDDERVHSLLKYLDSYLEFAANDLENYENYLPLFITILQNLSKIQLEDNFINRIWNICKKIRGIKSKSEEYAQILVLVFGLIPNESFSVVTTDLLDITNNSIILRDYELLGNHLNTWESVISCNLNPIKRKILTSVIESLLHKLIALLQDSDYMKTLYEKVFNFQKCLIQTNHFLLTSALVDMLILSTTLVMAKQEQDFKSSFKLAISLLDQLLKHRKPLIMDRLPPYLQQYRIILRSLCKKSNSDLNLGDSVIREISDCAHQLEKLTKNLVSHQKDMGRITMYLIADILEQYEQTSLSPSVKVHLNNCIYSFISICDQHAVSYLLRVLSSASTEIFKIMYENYKKYYRFTGKI